MMQEKGNTTNCVSKMSLKMPSAKAELKLSMQICSWMTKYLRFSPRQYFQMAGDPLGFLANGVNIQSGKLFFKGFIIIIPLILQHCRERIS